LEGSRHNIPASNAYKLCLALAVERDLVSLHITHKSKTSEAVLEKFTLGTPLSLEEGTAEPK